MSVLFDKLKNDPRTRYIADRDFYILKTGEVDLVFSDLDDDEMLSKLVDLAGTFNAVMASARN